MRFRLLLAPTLLVLACALVSVPTSAQPASAQHDSAQLDAFHARFEAVLSRHHIVGGGFAFVHAGQPATEFSFGSARLQPSRRVDDHTAYNWASITKTFTSIAIFQLRDRGLLSLNDPAVRYVPELRQIHDAFGPVDQITIRDLLTHSAGFRNSTWPWDCDDPKDCNWQPFEPTRWSQVAAMLPYTHIAFKPGTQWSYSNLGYVFLGQIIQRLSGDDFEVYITKNILMPLGMTESYFDRSPYYLEPHVSASYLRSGATLTPQPFNFDTGITTSNSGLKAPIPDMVKYARFLIGDPANPVDNIVLKRSSLQEAWTGVLPALQRGQPPTPYTSGPGGAQPLMGLGFFVLHLQGHRYVFHDGDQGGFSSELMIDPAGHTAAILAVNTTDTGAPSPASTLHPESNTEPDPNSDLRLTLRDDLIRTLFPAFAQRPVTPPR
ncbi:MAG TPA: serine hydrolase domain-containing protein [Terracidiphilus sp.]|nr:serine hydrolase domain-containing protein [Terracidiphilus sp.]